MPVAALPPRSEVRVEWRGDQFSRRVQNSVRRALARVGQEAYKDATGEEGANEDTGALIDSIQYRVPRRAARTQVYTLQFGVFPGESAPQRPGQHLTGNTHPNDVAEDYAYWQEVDPVSGRSYIREPMSRAMPHLGQYIAEEYTYKSGVVPGTIDFDSDSSEVNFSQRVDPGSRETDEFRARYGNAE